MRERERERRGNGGRVGQEEHLQIDENFGWALIGSEVRQRPECVLLARVIFDSPAYSDEYMANILCCNLPEARQHAQVAHYSQRHLHVDEIRGTGSRPHADARPHMNA